MQWCADGKERKGLAADVSLMRPNGIVKIIDQ
jgi:hypothetical protein